MNDDTEVVTNTLITGSLSLQSDDDGNVSLRQGSGSLVELTRRQAVDLKEWLSVVIDLSNKEGN